MVKDPKVVTNRPQNRGGIPRTAAMAKNMGRLIKIDFARMDDAEKKNWLAVSTDGARHGSLARIRIKTADPNVVYICYWNAQTQDYDCQEVDRGQVGF
jgi:hypothetical protein